MHFFPNTKREIMKNAFASILIGAAVLGFATVSTAATTEAQVIYKAAKEGAAADYKTAREKCNSFTGNPKNVCVKEAEADRTRTKAEAESRFKNTPRARASAGTAIANSEYGVAKAKCDSQTGNNKDVCIKEAKAAKIADIADAKADKKVVSARTEAWDDKRNAYYKVAIEKCDALTDAAKDNCTASAKAQFAK
jgi:hypothetical protein